MAMTNGGSRNRRARALAAASFLIVVLAAVASNASSLRLGTVGKSSSVTGPLPGNDLFTWYDTSLGDNILHLVNPNGCANGEIGCGAVTNLCAMIYVFDADQEMGECCGIPITPSQMETLSVSRQLTSNWSLAGTNNTNGVIAVVGSGTNDLAADGGCGRPSVACNAGCNPTLAAATVGSTNLFGGILHNQIFNGVTKPTEISLFENGAGDPINNTYLVEQCAALIGNSSGAGACSLLPPPPPPPTPAFLYVNNDGFPNQISAYKVFSDGTLEPVPGGPFPTGGYGVQCFDIDSATSSTTVLNQTLYATDSGSQDVSAQRINGDGTLTSLGTFLDSANSFPTGVAASSNGKFLFVGDGFSVPEGPGLGIDSFGINSDGTLTFLSMFPAGQQAGFDVIFDPMRDHVISNGNDNGVSVLKVGSGGTLTPLALSPYTTTTGDNHKMALRAQGDCLFVAGGVYPPTNNQAEVFQVDAAGNLTLTSGSPYALSGATFVIGTATVPSGQFVYFGTDVGVFGFSVGASCSLTPVPGSPAAAGSLSAGLVTDANGAFLFDVDSTDDDVRSFGIAADGSLSPISEQPLQESAGSPAFQFFCPSGLSYVQL